MPRVELVIWHRSLAPSCCEAFITAADVPPFQSEMHRFAVHSRARSLSLSGLLTVIGLSPFLDGSPSVESGLCGSVEDMGVRHW